MAGSFFLASVHRRVRRAVADDQRHLHAVGRRARHIVGNGHQLRPRPLRHRDVGDRHRRLRGGGRQQRQRGEGGSQAKFAGKCAHHRTFMTLHHNIHGPISH